jgi:hypothetical protein
MHGMVFSKFVLYSYSLLGLFVLLIPITTAFASTQPSISEVQRLLSLTNSSLLRDDLDGSIESLNKALSMVQELKEAEEGVNAIVNNNNSFSNNLEDKGGNDDYSDNDNDGGIVDDNVERSQECIKNAKPGEVCAL